MPHIVPEFRHAKKLTAAYAALTLVSKSHSLRIFVDYKQLRSPREQWFVMCIRGGQKILKMARRRRTVKFTRREMWPIWTTFIGLSGFAALGLWLFAPSAPPLKRLAAAEDVAIPLATLQLKTPILFSAPLPSGSTAEFFVERDSAESVTVAFSSCRRCYGAGHYGRPRQIFCRRCNQPMPRLAAGEPPSTEKDCVHIPIPFEVTEGAVRVQARVITDSHAQWYAGAVSQHAGNPDGSR